MRVLVPILYQINVCICININVIINSFVHLFDLFFTRQIHSFKVAIIDVSVTFQVNGPASSDRRLPSSPQMKGDTPKLMSDAPE